MWLLYLEILRLESANCLTPCFSADEGFVIYSFLMMCLAAIGYDSDIVNFWNRNGNPPLPSSWFWSTCCLGHVPLDSRFLVRCKQGVLQFVVVKLIMATVMLVCAAFGKQVRTQFGRFARKVHERFTAHVALPG